MFRNFLISLIEYLRAARGEEKYIDIQETAKREL
jgi:hypothetical protein